VATNAQHTPEMYGLALHDARPIYAQVQQELKLSDEQKSKVGEVATRVREAGPQRGQGGGQADREQLRERMQAMSRVVAEEEKKRSEEHTSELQSRENLVCRLLREK